MSLGMVNFSPITNTLKKNVNRLAGDDRIVLDVTDVIDSDMLKQSCARNQSGATAAAALCTVHRIDCAAAPAPFGSSDPVW